MAKNKNLNETLNDFGIKTKKVTLNSLLVSSGISEQLEVEEQEEQPDDVVEDLIEPIDKELKFALPDIPTGELLALEPEIKPEPEPEIEIDPLVVRGLEKADESYKKEAEEKKAVDERFTYETDWTEKYNFANQNLGIIEHNLNADLDKLVVKASLRITDEFGALIDEGPLLDQIYLHEDKQYGIGFLPVDENHVKVLTARDGIVWSSSSGESLDYRLIENLETSLGKVEFKITLHKMVSNISRQILEDIEREKLKQTGSVIYSGPAGAPGIPGAAGPSGVTEIRDKNMLYVRTEGDDAVGNGTITNPYLTIRKAVQTIIAPSQSNPFIIDVGPGEFAEDNSTGAIEIPSDTTVRGECNACHITGSDPTKSLFILNDHSSLIRVTLCDITNNSAVLADRAGFIDLKDIIIKDCQNGVESNNVNAIVEISNITAIGNLTNLLKVGPGRVRARNILVIGNATVETIFRVNGVGANLHTWITISYSTNVTNGIYVTNSGSSHNISTEINNAVNGCRLATNGIIYGSGFALDSTVYDIWQEDSTSVIEIDSGSFDNNKVKASDWSKVVFLSINPDLDDHAFHSTEEVHIGVPERGVSTSVGEGASITRGMLVYNYNGSTYTDVTAEAKSSIGGTFTLGIGINNAIYISRDLIDLRTSDYQKFLGISIELTQAFNLGAGTTVWEYYNGSGWSSFMVMRTQALYPYLPYSIKDPTSLVDTNKFHIRFNIELIKTGTGEWIKNDPPSTGANRYWVRYRVSTEITQGAIFNQIKMHTNGTKFNEDGWLAYFGTARPVGTLTWDAGLFEPFGGATPTNQDMYVSDTLGVGRVENNYEDGTIDRVGMNTSLPLDCDVSCPIRFQWSWVLSATSTGFCRWIVRWGYTSDTSSVYFSTVAAPGTGPNEQSITLDVPLNGIAANTQITSSISIGFSNTVARRSGGYGDIIWVVLERDGGADSYSGSVALINITPKYFKWCEGGHIDNLLSI